jgi:hypothetical protein
MTGCEVPARRANSPWLRPRRRLTVLSSSPGSTKRSYRIVYVDDPPEKSQSRSAGSRPSSRDRVPSAQLRLEARIEADVARVQRPDSTSRAWRVSRKEILEALKRGVDAVERIGNLVEAIVIRPA